MEAVVVSSKFCFACFGLHSLPNHTFDNCPLLNAAKSKCDCVGSVCSWESPACDRKLFSLLVSLQLFDGLVSHPLHNEDSSVHRLVDRLGLLHRIWASEVPASAFETFVKLEKASSEPKASLALPFLPFPAKWSVQVPVALCLDLWSSDGDFSVRELSRPFDVVLSANSAVLALSWKSFLVDVISGNFKWLVQGQLMPAEFRSESQDALVTVPGGKFSQWSPVLMNVKRGFLMCKGERRRWKAFSQLSPQKISELEKQLKSDSRVGGRKIAIAEGTDESLDEFNNVIRKSSINPMVSADASQLYHAFSRGFVESDGEDEASGERGEDEVDGGLQPVQAGLYPASSDQTATGAFRDSLAQFAAQYASQQEEQVSSAKASRSKSKSKKKKKSLVRRSSGQEERTWMVEVKERVGSVTSGAYAKMSRVCTCRGVYVIPLLGIVSSLMALIATAMDVLPFLASSVLRKISAATPLLVVNWFLFLLWMAGFSFVAAFLTLHVYPVISGSGIPEIRAILSGASLPQYLKAYVTPVKIVGVLCMVSSGLWVGKEGPSVHIACLVGCLVVRMFPVFEPMRKNRTLYRWLLSSCAALGPAAIFGTPIGGVLYAVEATSSYFSVSELFYSFVSAVPAALLVRLLHWLYYTSTLSLAPIADVVFQTRTPTAGQFFWAIFLAVIIGFLGPLFVELSSKIVQFRRWVFQKSPFLGNQILYFVLIVVASALLYFPAFIGPFMGVAPLEVVNAMLSENPKGLINDGWLDFGLMPAMTVFFVVKFVMLALIVSFPGPTGVFMPTLAAGSVLGRFFGELYASFAAYDTTGSSYVPASFAAIGCAAMGVSVTQTLSTAVMVIELTGQVNLLLPVLVASIISFMISQAVTGKVGLYERVALDRRLPLLFDLPHRLLQMSAADIMTTVAWDSPGEGRVTVIEAQCTLETLDALLDDGFDPSASYPVVESIQSKMLLGFVSGYDLMSYRTDIIRKLEFASKFRSRGSSMRSSLTRSFSILDETVLPVSAAQLDADDRRSAQAVIDQVQETINPIKLSKVEVAVSPKSSISFVHQLMALNGSKLNVLPVCEKGRLVGLIFRADVIETLMPRRFKSKE